MEAIVTVRDIEVDVVFEYYEGEVQTYDYPGSAPEVEIEGVFIGEEDIMDILDPSLFEDIEESLLEIVQNR